MNNIKIKREKLKKFLIKEIPGLLPFIGDLWKDAVDEFTESDLDGVIELIEDFQKMNRETQKKLLLEILLLKKDANIIKDIMLRIEQHAKKMQIVRNFVNFNLGNAAFLSALQDSDEVLSLRFNITKEFRNKYLEMLEDMFKENEFIEPPFALEKLNALIAFPDGYEKYVKKIRNPELHRPSAPVLISNAKITKEYNVYYIESGIRKQIPWLPIQNGFIQEIDKDTNIVSRVGDEPSEEYSNAYYWVRPNGLRIVVMGIGVLDPLECQFGTAIWWKPDDSSSLLGVRASKEVTAKTKRQVHKATVQSYIKMIKKYVTSKQEN